MSLFCRGKPDRQGHASMETKNMTIQEVKAFFKMEVGSRIIYSLNFPGEGFDARNFHKRYKGRTATIVGFPVEYIGPLDRKGRLPGTYIVSGYADIRFDDEEIVLMGINLNLFTLRDIVPMIRYEEIPPHQQRLSDLPYAIDFYPGDRVKRANDLIQAIRTVYELLINGEGNITYMLEETADAKHARNEAEATRRRTTKGYISAVIPWHTREICGAKDLVLSTRGNVYNLYNEPENLIFPTDLDEMRFWGQDALSSMAFKNDERGLLNWMFTLAEAQVKFSGGEGDLIVTNSVMRHVSRGGLGPLDLYNVRMLHDQFVMHRDHVRKLSKTFPKPPNMDDEPVVLGAAKITMRE